MADEDLDLDVKESGGKKITKLLIIVLIVVVLIIGGVVTWLMMGSKSEEGDNKSGNKEAEIARPTAIYHSLKPTFIVNFADASKVAYLQTDIDIMTYEQSVIDAVQEHMPVIRNNILLVLGSHSYESISTSAGKETLRKDLLESINKVLVSKASKKNDNKKDKKDDGASKKEKKPDTVNHNVQQVYFTSFIMQ